jgi:hypothetical protein
VVLAWNPVNLDDCRWPSVFTAVNYFELNTGWHPRSIGQSTRTRAFLLPDSTVEPSLESFRPFGNPRSRDGGISQTVNRALKDRDDSSTRTLGLRRSSRARNCEMPRLEKQLPAAWRCGDIAAHGEMRRPCDRGSYSAARIRVAASPKSTAM